MNKIILPVFLVFSMNCMASEVFLTSGFVSHHVSSNKYNESNTGVGIEIHVNDNIKLNAGRYHNSKWKMTNYATVAYMVPIVDSLDARMSVGAMTGAATGYKRDRTILMFAMVSSFDYRINTVKVGVNFLVIPEYKTSPTTFALQTKIGF